MEIAITGSSGLVGSALCSYLQKKNHRVRALVHENSHKKNGAIIWLDAEGSINEAAFEGCDVVIHLAGENIASGRWTEAKKNNIRKSRVTPTTKLSSTLSAMASPPKTFICASAIGYYGECGSESVDETHNVGTTFLADVCKEWEHASQIKSNKNIRVVNLRFGMILSAQGGALKKMVTPFKLGLGGKLGSGNQYMSWITLDDVLGIVDFVIDNPTLTGPCNAVSTGPVTNAEFTKLLGERLHRPTIFTVPAAILRLIFGDMADDALLCSCKAMPGKLSAAGYNFQFPILKQALEAMPL